MNKRTTTTRWLLAIACTLSLPPAALWADEIDEHLAAISQAGPGGKGSDAAREASRALAEHDATLLPRLLMAMDTPNIVAANWYRTVYETIVARELAKDDPQLPLDVFRDYVRNPQRAGRTRRLALRLVDRFDPEFRAALLPTLLDDDEFFNDAVELALQAGDAAKKAGDEELARSEYRKAFAAARQTGHILQAAARLKQLGQEMNIAEQLGLLTRWYLIGPFDAPGTTGFDLHFPPEENVELEHEYVGKGGEKIGWKAHETTDRLGLVNMIGALGPTAEAVGYAYCEVVSPRDQAAQVRCGADDNISVWLNGRQVFARRQWLNGNRFDRFAAPVQILKGKNVVLVKICQGPQHKNPAVPNNWSFQLRICNSKGTGLGLQTILPEAPSAE